MKRTVPKLAWLLIGLLAIASAILNFGHEGSKSNPEAQSYSVSGTSALVELLRRSGFDVRIDQRSKPRLASDEVAVAFLVPAPEDDPNSGEPPAHPTLNKLRDFARSGGRVLSIAYPPDFQAASAPVFDGSLFQVTDVGQGAATT